MTTDQNKAIALIIPLIVKNNAGKVSRVLKDAGYSKDFIPGPELEARLFQLYTANPDMFFDLMKTIPWNYGEIETNKPEIREELRKLVAESTGHPVSKETWWPELVSLLDPRNSQRPAPAVKTSSEGVSNWMIFFSIIAIIGIIIALYLIFK